MHTEVCFFTQLVYYIRMGHITIILIRWQGYNIVGVSQMGCQ